MSNLRTRDLTLVPASDPSEGQAERIARNIVSRQAPLNTASERYDFGQVRVHTGVKAAQSAKALDATAYTIGNDIFFGANQFAPATHKWRVLIAHELAHVVQQASAVAPPATPSLIHRQRANYHAGGCATCTSASAAGSRAHPHAQRLFGRDVIPEVPIYNPNDEDDGRLDLLRIDKFSRPKLIEFGEIKPDNDRGVSNGRKDLQWYEEQLTKKFDPPDWLVSRLDIAAPSQTTAFKDNARQRCPSQLLSVRKAKIGGPPGLYLYKCDPPGRQANANTASCCQQDDDDDQRPPQPPVIVDPLDVQKGDSKSTSETKGKGNGQPEKGNGRPGKEDRPGNDQPQPTLRLPSGPILDKVIAVLLIIGTFIAVRTFWGKIGALLGMLARAAGITLGIGVAAGNATAAGGGQKIPVPVPVSGGATTPSTGSPGSRRQTDRPKEKESAKSGTTTQKAGPKEAVRVSVIEGLNAERVAVGNIFPVSFASGHGHGFGNAILQVTRVTKEQSFTTVEFTSLQEAWSPEAVDVPGQANRTLGGNKAYVLTVPFDARTQTGGLIGYLMYTGKENRDWLLRYFENLANELEASGQKRLASQVRNELQRLH
jgi:hypothetical protein